MLLPKREVRVSCNSQSPPGGVIAADEVFLMNAAADSLDGRYFGPLPAASIIGRAAPLWTHPSAEEE
ncbi:MAG: S26 family signal peptidase [Hyphomicrobiales bacterium]|nr:S26 family signal peptidase [Hyphomicrobiales bacterium]